MGASQNYYANDYLSQQLLFSECLHETRFKPARHRFETDGPQAERVEQGKEAV